jgi:hypothetical protein
MKPFSSVVLSAETDRSIERQEPDVLLGDPELKSERHSAEFLSY